MFFHTKGWAFAEDFDIGQVAWRLCHLLMDIMTTKPHAHAITVISRVIHYMISYIVVPNWFYHDK